MERELIFGYILALLLISGIAVDIAVPDATTFETRSPCSTDTCVKEAAYILNRMNISVSPCDNFYDFTCGGYIASTEIPEDKLEVDPLSILTGVVYEQIKQIITKPPEPNELRVFKMLKKLYSACVNTTAIEEQNLEKMKSLFTSLGGWPVLEKNNWQELNWIDITRKLRQHGLSTGHFMAVNIYNNPKDVNEYIIAIEEAENEEIGEDNLKRGLRDRLVWRYANYMIELAIIMGADKEFATNEIQAVMEFRQNIAKLLASKLQTFNLIISANETTVASLQQRYPSIEWVDFINGALGIPNRRITPKDKVLLVDTNYVSKFEELINKTPKRVQVNHALLQVLRSMVHYLPRAIREKEQQFGDSVTGTTKSLPRSDICITVTIQNFNLATDALYVRTFVDETARSGVAEMVSHTKTALQTMINDVDWMDSNTKKQAIQKAEAITELIAYPPQLRDDIKLEEYYTEITFNSDNLLDLATEISKHKRDKLVSLYNTTVVQFDWTSTGLPSVSSNAIYDPQTNSIQIPSGIIQREFYNKDRPMYLNYGTLGFIIGHELTHGFDSNGRKFNKEGNALDWWEPSTDTAFNLKAKCYIEQFGNFTVPEVRMRLNGEATLAENIADGAGMKGAYLAYLEWVKQHKEEPQLPGMHYTPRQLFWISLASSWCGKIRRAALAQSVMLDEHSPNRYRILGGVANIPGFSKDFSCPLGSKMNPKNKCQIW